MGVARVIVDTSALLAVVLQEPEAASFTQVMLTGMPRMSAASYVEAQAVVSRYRRPELRGRLDRIVKALGVQIVEVSAAQALLAAQAYYEFGRGSGHRANLNFGDVFAYALAITEDEPLLFKGDDFSQTDVRLVVG